MVEFPEGIPHVDPSMGRWIASIPPECESIAEEAEKLALSMNPDDPRTWVGGTSKCAGTEGLGNTGRYAKRARTEWEARG